MPHKSPLAIAAALAIAAPGFTTAHQTSAPASSTPTPAQAREIASNLAGELEANFVHPDVGRRYATRLRGRAAAGAYDGLGSREALAQALTQDVQAVAPDNHLHVSPGRPQPLHPAAGQAAPSGSRLPAMEDARWLAPGIAYVRFNEFPQDAAITTAADRFMAEHATARTIIFDLRTNRGGWIQQMDAMFPYLFGKPTVLVWMDARRAAEEARPEERREPRLRILSAGPDVVRREHFVLPHARERRLRDAKVFVLTSGRTGSAGEHFALAMKRTGRATLIGEASAGANHFGGPQQIGHGFLAFVPVGRTFDPETGKDWEGVGVAPDVPTPAPRALYEALIRSGLGRTEAERIAAPIKPQGSMERRRPRA